MWKWLRWLLLVLLLVALYYWLTQKPTLDIQIIHASRGTVEQTIANTRAGTVTACQRAKMSLPIGGQIEQILVKEGDHVSQGQLLLSLWHKDKQTKKQQLLALVAASQNHKNQACILADKAQNDAKRQASLLKQKLTSEENLEQAQAQADAAKANCLAFEAELQANQAAVKNIDAYLEQTQLIAPFDGIIAEITGEIGEYTTPSPPGVPTPPAVDILTDSCHYISAPIDEVDAAELTVDRPVKITLDAFRGQSFNGTLRRIAPYIQDYEKQARTVTVEVDITDHQSPHFLAGYSADIEVIIASKKDVLRLPSDLILNNDHVLIVNHDNVIEQRPIKVGLNNWQYTEIIQGLSPQDKVVASIGLAGVMPGAQVTVSEKPTDNN